MKHRLVLFDIPQLSYNDIHVHTWKYCVFNDISAWMTDLFLEVWQLPYCLFIENSLFQGIADNILESAKYVVAQLLIAFL